MTKEEAIDVLEANYPDPCFSDLRKAVDMAIEALKESKRKKGKWHIFKGTGLASCECGYITDRYSIYDFCPVCGAKNER